MCTILTKKLNEREIKEFVGYLRDNRTDENPQSTTVSFEISELKKFLRVHEMPTEQSV